MLLTRFSALLISCYILCLALPAQARKLIRSGPMAGPADTSRALLWLESHPAVTTIYLSLQAAGSQLQTNRSFAARPGFYGRFFPQSLLLDSLRPGTTYYYTLRACSNTDTATRAGLLHTAPAMQEPAAIRMLAASCAFMGRLHALNTERGLQEAALIQRLAGSGAQLMLWLGDNWYSGREDYQSPEGMMARASHDRQPEALQALLGAMNHLAIWDDHDYGPDNAGAGFAGKKASLEAFRAWWPSMQWGHATEGTYRRIAWGDVVFYLLDNRWWRAEQGRRRQMLGSRQLQWLQQQLLADSRYTFKLILNGSQVVRSISEQDAYHAEWQSLLDFTARNRVGGVLFLSGDRHFTEINRLQRPGHYPIYDLTTSPLTSDVGRPSRRDRSSPNRVHPEIIQTQNAAVLEISGPLGNRILNACWINYRGDTLLRWQLAARELQYP